MSGFLAQFLGELRDDGGNIGKALATGLAENTIGEDIAYLRNFGIRLNSQGIAPSPAELYQWNHTYLSPLAMVNEPPPADLPSMEWSNKVGQRLLDLAENAIAFDASAKDRTEIAGTIASLQRVVDTQSVGLNVLRDLVAKVARFGRVNDGNSDRPQTMDGYAALFRTIELPAIASDFNQDSAFAAMRTAGPNPIVIERIRRPMDNFPVTEKQYQFVIPGDSLEAAFASGRVYVCDYKMLDKLPTAPVLENRKYLYAPIAMFAEHPTTRALVPIAIQTAQQPDAARNNLFIADGSYDWLIAKTIVGCADGTVHEPVSHLGKTHLFVEPFVVATGRNLPAGHPVCRLLWPHFEGTIFINYSAAFSLVAPGGDVESLMAPTLSSMLGMAADQLVNHYPFDGQALPKALAERDVQDLKDYAYRDDALLYWNAIRNWVGNYLGIFYRSDADIQADAPLQSWYRDLVSQDGGRVKGFGDGVAIRTQQQLIEALATVIYTSSVQHAAVNFPQLDMMSYCPNMPQAAYAQFPGDAPAGPQQYLDILPTMSRAKEQLVVMYTLGAMHYTQLGQYPADYFSGVGIPPLNQFQSELADAGRTIQVRNTNRRPYKTLMPSAIPQSINI